MSLILGYANKDNAMILSDGRAGENGSYSEHFNKTMKINNNIIMGFAGYVEPLEFFINHLIQEMGDDRENDYIDDFLELIEFLMDDKETQEKLRSAFLIIGRNTHGDMFTCNAGDVSNYKVEKHLVENVRISSIGGTIEGKIINEIFSKNIKNKAIPIQDCMINTIKEVATLDNSVNTNIFGQMI